MEVRINKFLSEAGVCSRRAADELVLSGRVTIDGKKAVMGSKVNEAQEVCVDGRKVFAADKKVVLAFNKPVGIVCTAAPDEKNNVIDYIGYDRRIFPIGRLDKASEGLLLLTNDGELMNSVLKAANGHEKEYIVTVDKEITQNFIKGMSKGVPILDRMTNPCPVEKLGAYKFRIILTQGLNRQIRRMCEYFGYEVVKLKRIRIMNIELGDLRMGQYREICGAELEELYKGLRG
jgi:23S rRNA pseudouridine2604 synthase